MKSSDLRKLQQDRFHDRITENVLALFIILLLIAVAIRLYDEGLTKATLTEFFTIIEGPRIAVQEAYAVDGVWPAEQSSRSIEVVAGEIAPETAASLIQNVVASGSLASGQDKPSTYDKHAQLNNEELRYVVRDGAINFAVKLRNADPNRMWILGLQPATSNAGSGGSVYWVCGYGRVPEGRSASGQNLTNLPVNNLFSVCRP